MQTNKLINESSPYLQQHAHNPVNWYPWGDEAISLAKQLDKPILVSIGYSACHWCHVMERESFENDIVAKIMNENFINIKIDREERPDLDHIYMEAVQVMTGSGGWPLNVFLTPQLEPFYGGTYFPPRKSMNMPSWMEVLSGVSSAWALHRDDLLKQAADLVAHLKAGSELKGAGNHSTEELFSPDYAKQIIDNILKTADKYEGGFGNAPKFPQTFSIQNLFFAETFFKREDALVHAHLSLEKMLRGGIYDQLGGGLARYSTDAEWLAPHFEKMLYDNALFISTLSEAFQVSGNKEYMDAIHHTFSFLQREMKHEEGGYFAALDADSEGEEGKFYVWTKDEITKALPDKAEMICKFYDVSDKGNWEGKNILRIRIPAARFAEEAGMDLHEWESILVEANARLMQERNKRVRPSTDDKILLSWNAMLVSAFCKAYEASNFHGFLEEALSLFAFCESTFVVAGNKMKHTYKNGEARGSANLEDYATMISAAIKLQEVTGDQRFIELATSWTEIVTSNFSAENGMFYFTAAGEPNILFRKTEVFDGAVPSANALMVQNLFYLGTIWNKQEWKDRATSTVKLLHQNVVAYPSSFGVWANMILHRASGIPEVVVAGDGFNSLLAEVLKIYLPNKVLQSNIGGSKFPLLRGKSNSKAMIHICKNYTCLPPMSSVADYVTYVKNNMIK